MHAYDRFQHHNIKSAMVMYKYITQQEENFHWN